MLFTAGADLMEMTIGRCGPITTRIRAPPSKSYTHRALIIAALADGISHITGQLDADDTRITARALAQLGVKIVWQQDLITVYGTGGRLHEPGCPINIGDSGTTMRLLTAVCLLADGPVLLTGSDRMQERPIGPLVDALNQAGADISYTGMKGCPPLLISGSLPGGLISIDGSVSSQFISSLLIASPYAQSAVQIQLTGQIVSEPYIRITTEIMELFGVKTENPKPGRYHMSAHSRYHPSEYIVEGDYSSASYWFALAAVTGGTITIDGLNPESMQGDRRFLEILAQMGCTIRWEISDLSRSCNVGTSSVTISRNGPIQGIKVDMSDCPDVVQTLAMVAAIAITPSRIMGIHHLREKESDRISAIVDGLNQLGGRAESSYDEIQIYPAPLHGGIIQPKRDHRTAMSFAILGTVIGGVTILDAGCVTKSYPEFWEVFKEVWKIAESC
ncbi:MAG TPA: 3-phosphoshikimate 1-carboxyvinyltransferase [Methanospirillum sp.]|nr:3-phosphoshikimate 1-carboxyvinyltransferase [Methanospirillum sp.]